MVQLQQQTHLTVKQIRVWFTNQRQRRCKHKHTHALNLQQHQHHAQHHLQQHLPTADEIFINIITYDPFNGEFRG